MKLLSILLSFILVLACGFLCFDIVLLSRQNQQLKFDNAELNDIRYGMLSIEGWKGQLTGILAAEIDALSLSKTNQDQLRGHIQEIMEKLIDKVAEKVRDSNKGSAGGWVKQRFIDMFVSLKEIKSGIPEYTNTIMAEMTDDKTAKEVKSLLTKKLQEYADQTADYENLAEMSRILRAHNAKDIGSARDQIQGLISSMTQHINDEAMLLFALSIMIFSLAALSKGTLNLAQFLPLVLVLVALLVAGVMTPMIDMEAKISSLSFVIIGHPVHFENQILYFQSKSIWDVFRLMIVHPDVKMKCVGILVVTFSVVFPLFKILALLFYQGIERARNSPIVKFFVFHSGKWSMADVMVVGIFMAYIGFNGIIDSQLGNLHENNADIKALTTNGTSLQPGYYIFLTFVLLAIALSEIISRKKVVPEPVIVTPDAIPELGRQSSDS